MFKDTDIFIFSTLQFSVVTFCAMIFLLAHLFDCIYSPPLFDLLGLFITEEYTCFYKFCLNIQNNKMLFR